MDKEEIINKIQEAKRATIKETGSYKYNFAYEEVISIIEENVENEEKSPYEFEDDEKVVKLNSNGGTWVDKYRNIDWAEYNKRQGNIFRTEEEAFHEKDKREAIHKIKKYIYDRFGYDPTDWFGLENKKYFITYDFLSNKFEWTTYYYCYVYSPIGHLKTRDQAQEIIDNFEEELKIIFNI